MSELLSRCLIVGVWVVGVLLPECVLDDRQQVVAQVNLSRHLQFRAALGAGDERLAHPAFGAGNDYFGEEVKRIPGALTEPNNIGDTIILKFPTFTETANMAGISRVLGGYHIQSDNIEGLKLGRNIAGVIWKKYIFYTGQSN